MPTPSPSPTLAVVLQQADQGWWSMWGATVFTVLGSVAASFLVAYFALRGARTGAKDNADALITSAEKNADALIGAETERAKNARDHDDYRWLRGARAKAYFGIIASTHAAVDAARQVVWFSRPHVWEEDEEDEGYRAAYPEGLVEQTTVWNAASTEAQRWAAEVRAVGNKEVARLARDSCRAARACFDAASDARKVRSQGVEVPQKSVARKDLKKMEALFRDMVALIRMELGSDNAGVPDPESLAASSTTSQHEG